MSDRGWGASFRYRFDTYMAKGGGSIFVSLTAVFIAILVLIACVRGLLLWLFPIDVLQMEHEGGFFLNMYITFLQLTDPGNMAQDIGSSGAYKFTAILAGLSGTIMLSALIAFITTALDQKLAALKRGRSKVIEDGHSLILGWNEQRVVEILRELILANESERDECVVVLGDEDKEEMDDLLRMRLPDTKTTRLVTRSGDVSTLPNLDMVSVETCRSVIIIGSCEDSAGEREKNASDAKTMQTILAVTSMRPEDDDLVIVAEIFNPTYRKVVEHTFSENVVTVDTKDVLAKIMVQTSRSVGLSVVYNEILSFDGCEMYFCEDDWGDMTFSRLPYRFPDGVPMGVRHADGGLMLNPPLDYAMKADDAVLILADDDSTIAFQSQPVAEPRELSLATGRLEQRQEQELLLGWSDKAPVILEQYADYVMDDSRVDVMLADPEESVVQEIEAVDAALSGLDVRLVKSNRLRADDLIAVEPFKYNNIIILADDASEENAQQVDSENIVTLLLLREIFRGHPEESANTKLVTEVLDSQNYPLVAEAGVKDVIISNRLVSMMLAQISESKDIKRVYDDIFEEDGSEIYLKPLHLYADAFPVTLSYADMIGLAQKRSEVCLGLKVLADERKAEANYGVTLIPPKDQTFTLGPDDSFVVLAEDEW